MLRALLYLRLMSFRNWTVSRVRRLRQPKYLAGALVGVAYFYFFFFRGLPHPRAGGQGAVEAMANAGVVLAVDGVQVATAVGGVILLVILAVMWIVPTRPAALGFSEAEIAFLFPAPMTRRALIHFRLLSSQLRSLLGATVMMLFSSRWAFLDGNVITHAVGWWFIFSALNLHFSGAGFTLTRLAERGFGTWRRRTLVLVSLVAVLAVTILRIPEEFRLPPLAPGVPPAELARWLIGVTHTAPLGWLLWPVQIVLAPFLAASGRSFAFALLPALAILVIHYLWVVRTAVAFEDATIEQAGSRAARLAAWRAGDRRAGRAPWGGRGAPFRLGATGRPETAFLWKNLLSTWPYFTPRVLVGAGAAIVAACVWLDRQPQWRGALPIAGAFAFVFAGYTLVVGPQFARQDLRSDLPNADVLKTYPLAGWQIVLGQLLAPTAILTGVLWLTILVVGLAFQPGHEGSGLTPQLRLTATAVAALNVPALAALQLLVPNAATLLLPGWFQASRGRGGGLEVVGQRMIFFFAQVLVMLLALLPPALFAGLLMFIVQWLLGPISAVLLGGAVTLAAVVGELWLGLWWLGRRFEQLDLASELRP